jgi:hypothetical protein
MHRTDSDRAGLAAGLELGPDGGEKVRTQALIDRLGQAEKQVFVRNVLSLPLELERLTDRAFPGREAVVRNEAPRQISRRLQRLPP